MPERPRYRCVMHYGDAPRYWSGPLVWAALLAYLRWRRENGLHPPVRVEHWP